MGFKIFVMGYNPILCDLKSLLVNWDSGLNHQGNHKTIMVVLLENTGKMGSMLNDMATCFPIMRSFLWCLFVKNKISNGLNMSIKNVVLQWWISKTRVNPNKFDVTNKRLETTIFDEKPTHFLMQTQVCLHLLNCLVVSISCMGQEHLFFCS
jgi:hypothetical protein